MQHVIGAVLDAAWIGYIISSMVVDHDRAKGERSPAFNTIWWICKWPALAQVIWDIAAKVFLDHQAPTTWDIFFALFELWVWWRLRNSGDDDEFKKMRERLTESVKQMGGKLVIVPNPA